MHERKSTGETDFGSNHQMAWATIKGGAWNQVKSDKNTKKWQLDKLTTTFEGQQLDELGQQTNLTCTGNLLSHT